MVDIVEKEVKMEDKKKLPYPSQGDNVDKAIIDILNKCEHSISINTLKNRYMKSVLDFDNRVERLSKTVDGFKLWEEKKPTLQVGTDWMYKEQTEDSI